MKERNDLIKELFKLHKLLAEKGEITIGKDFSKTFKKLEEKVDKLTHTDYDWIPLVSSNYQKYQELMAKGKLIKKYDDGTIVKHNRPRHSSLCTHFSEDIFNEN